MSPTRIALLTDERHSRLHDASTYLRALTLYHPDDIVLREYVVAPPGISAESRTSLLGLRARLIMDGVAASWW